MPSDPSTIEVNDIGFLPAHHSVSGTTKAKPSRKLPGGRPTWGIAYSSYQKRLYVAGENPGQIRVYDVRHSRDLKQFRYIYRPDVIFTPPLDGTFPAFITCGPKNKAYAFVATQTSGVSDSITLINTTTNKATLASRVPTPRGWANIAFSPDGKTSYFPHGNVLYALDEQSEAPPVPIQLSVSGYWVTVTNDGAYAYVGGGPGDDTDAHVVRVDLATQKQKDIVKNLDDTVNTFDVSFDNKKLFVTTEDNVIRIVDIESNTAIGTIDYSGGLVPIGQISCSKVSPYACVALQTAAGGEAAIIDTVKNTKRGSFPLPADEVTCTAFDEFGNAYVGTDDQGVMVILHTKIETMGPASSAS